MAMRAFLASEEAAITTDWVVATAAVTAMGLATVTLVSGGMEDISGGIAHDVVGAARNGLRRRGPRG